MRFINILICLFALALSINISSAAAKPKPGSYILATASAGGTYYPVGVALATLTKVKIQPKFKVSISAINSAGSGENVKLLREDEAQFAILQGLYGSYAWSGTGPIKQKQSQLRSVSMLWQNVEQIIISSEYAKSGTVSDLNSIPKSAHLALGKKNSGTIGSNREIFANLGINIDQYKLVHAGYGPSATALQDGRVVGINTPAGVPTGAITKLLASVSDKVTLLDMSDAQAKKADGGRNLWTRYVIPANTYPNQPKAWNTIAQPNFLATNQDVDEEFVYLLTKTMYENLPFLNAIHKATKAMHLEKAIAGLPVPLHKGAARFYKEKGIKIPAHLLVD